MADRQRRDAEFRLCNPGLTSEGPLQLGRPQLLKAQRADHCLAKCFKAVKPKEELLSVPVLF